MKKRLRVILPLIILVAASIFAYRQFTSQKNGDSLVFSGNIEVTEAQMSFQIPGRLTKRFVEEGDFVKSGQLLAKLDDADQKIGLTKAEANFRHARALLAELEAGSRPEEIERARAGVAQARESLAELQRGSRVEEIDRSQAELESAQAAEQTAKVQLNQAKKDLARYTRLQDNKSISENVFETFQTNFDTAINRVQEAQARTRAAKEQLSLVTAGPRIEQIKKAEAVLKQAEAHYNLIKAGPRKEIIEQAKAKVQLAEAEADSAHLLQSYTELFAPMDGVVLNTSAEQGEYLNPGSPVLTLGRLNKPWMRAYIDEKSLGLIQLNQTVEVRVDSYPEKKFSGRLSYISSQAEFTPKTVQTFEERIKLMYRIKVELDNPELVLKPGMPADGYLDLVVSQSN